MNHEGKRYPFLDHLSPGQPLTSSSPPPGPAPWYKSAPDTSIDGLERASPELDLLSAASTPLHVNHAKSVLFTSPLKKLDNLHLSREDPVTNQTPAEDYSDSDGSNFDAGNQTIAGALYSSDSENDPLAASEPKFVRKRKHTESPMELTPSYQNTHNTQSSYQNCYNSLNVISDFNADISIPHNTTNEMSVCGNETTDSILKASFSASDSTPCPIPRKKLKPNSSFEHTPSQPSRLSRLVLDFTSSRKVSASSAPLLTKLNDATEDPSDESPNSSFMSAKLQKTINSTPISLSTPANSRPASPEFKESDEEINGYKFIKPSFKYQTPQSRSTNDVPYHVSAKSFTAAFNSNKFEEFPSKYEIVGDFPVSAAGLMDENDTSVHVADKRINDPYLGPSNDTEELFDLYMESTDKLPLRAHFERDLTKSEMKRLIDDGCSVMLFYESIFPGHEMRTFLKRERLRWHPDKWVSRLEVSIFDKLTIDSLSQVINTIVDGLQ